jgi:mRNA interferase YafQ
MRVIKSTAQFRRDLKKMEKQGKEIPLLTKAVELLSEEALLPSHYMDHLLKGNWSGHRELHVESDWLLIYKIRESEVILIRTGTHTELLRK